MREIKGKITSKYEMFLGGESPGHKDGMQVKTFHNLVEQIAELSFLNEDFLLFFRGQASDYRNKGGRSTFYPTIYRGDRLLKEDLGRRFARLSQASRLLVKMFEEQKISGVDSLRRKRYIQWSVLQHYEVCPTPLIDFTHSLRVAASFAALKNEGGDAYIYAFGLPYVTNRISHNSEHDMVNIRLLSICPPSALRPYYQEGYLAATEDIEAQYDSKNELDFNRRLVAKFKFRVNSKFWGKDFHPIPENALYPKRDSIRDLCDSIKAEIDTFPEGGTLSEFIILWSRLEKILFGYARNYGNPRTLLQALRILSLETAFDSNILKGVDELRTFRNTVVHAPLSVSDHQIDRHTKHLAMLLKLIEKN